MEYNNKARMLPLNEAASQVALAKGRTPLPLPPSIRQKWGITNNTLATEIPIGSPVAHGSIFNESDASHRTTKPVALQVNINKSGTEPTSVIGDIAPNPTTPKVFTYAGVVGYEFTKNGETRFMCIECERDYKYTKKNISSHYNHAHDKGSSYYRRRMSLLLAISCHEHGCEANLETQQDIVDHYRRIHGLTGSSKQLLTQYGF
ncbi:hypothetical protein F4804DRAFT_338864 [Jackrogersella minutella]|nr:hypothetical protein F4804DRAFT_338864 [Jackrogersella minutella]